MDERVIEAINSVAITVRECTSTIQIVQKVYEESRDKDRKSNEKKTIIWAIVVVIFFAFWFNCSMSISKINTNINANTNTNIVESNRNGDE